jgi:spore germination protein PF
MPAIIGGPLHIANIGGSGVVHFGDSAITSPKSASKTFAGCGGFCTGAFVLTNNGISSTNVLDTNLIEQPTIGNN